MANIYLRLPSVICSYHRNYDVERKLDPFEPLKFSPYTDHAATLRSGLILYTKTCGKRSSCYSQQEWKNLLNGKSRDGQRQILKRDATQWLSYNELCTLEGVLLSKRSENYDYLCIQIPKTILVGDREVKTNASYLLTPGTTKILQILLINDFKRALVDWEIGTFNHCTGIDNGYIRRGRMDTLERFLMRYDIPISKDSEEKDTLRRQLDRWFEKAKMMEKAYRTFDIEYEDTNDKVVKYD